MTLYLLYVEFASEEKITEHIRENPEKERRNGNLTES